MVWFRTVRTKVKDLKSEKNHERVHRTFHLCHMGYLAMGSLELHAAWIYMIMLGCSLLVLVVWKEWD